MGSWYQVETSISKTLIHIMSHIICGGYALSNNSKGPSMSRAKLLNN